MPPRGNDAGDVSMRTRGLVAVTIAALICSPAAAQAANALVDAVKSGNQQAVRTLLRQRVDVNAAEADGTTALHWAVRADDQATVALLLRANASPKSANRYGITPLS